MEFYLGDLNEHAVGIVMKEVIRRAVVTIRNRRLSFEVSNKQGIDGGEDVFTDADTAAQELYLQFLRQCFPDCGIIAEEQNLCLSSRAGVTAYFTVDPIDGTRAFIRSQSHGIGTMLALVDNGEVLAAGVGDVTTEELYYYRPGSDKVHRVTRWDISQQLSSQRPSGLLIEGHALLRDPLVKYSQLVKDVIARSFKSHSIDGGSIGIWLARLWKGEVAAAFMLPGNETPWDSSPVIGITRKLGYVFMRPDSTGRYWERYTPQITDAVYHRDHETMIVHQDHLLELVQ